MCQERFPSFTSRKDLALEIDYCDSIRPCKPPTRRECATRFPKDHDLKYLTKKYENIVSDYSTANFAILLFADQTQKCFDEKKFMSQDYTECMKAKEICEKRNALTLAARKVPKQISNYIRDHLN